MTHSFRLATAADAPALAALINKCYRGEESTLGWTTEFGMIDGDRTDEAQLRELIARGASAILMCESGGQLLGSVYVARVAEGTGYLGMLVVEPKLQARGLGRRIMEAAERHVQETWECSAMTMTVIATRAELVAFYQRRGYRKTGERSSFTAGGGRGQPKGEFVLEHLRKALPERKSE